MSPSMPSAISAVIPVLDLMIGQVVLAQSGNRDAYLPVHSRLTNSSRPLDVAQAMFNQTGCDCLYLADIDSFAGASPNWTVYNQLLDRGFGLWIDADWMSDDRCALISEKINRPEKLKVILSSETMSRVDQFGMFADLIGRGIDPIFSLDKQANSVITQPGELSDRQPLELVRLAFDQGVRDLIVLELDRVGTMTGYDDSSPTLVSLVEEIRNELPEVRLISGGGVRDAGDIQALLDIGCQHVLVASAIHGCRLTPFDVAGLIPIRNSNSLPGDLELP